ncbi:MAG TPA: LysM peptidoglycan-binding domain-containing protein [Spirochaetota bacterium]|nr:LysM peptidoglycan-binding domain-containing protein [Spirochaetota bacterium]HQE59949.1 LysM peptidoglycan-binding domain-containing protein [Spirochaetota bacterium]
MRKSCLFLVPLLFFAVSCGFELPLNEMSSAKVSLSKAKSVDAEKFASDEYSAASDFLMKSHEAIRDEKAEDAKANAVKAKTSADQAYEKALPLWSESYLAEAKKSVDEMKSSGSEKFAPQEHDSVIKLLEDAEKDYSDKKYFESKDKSVQVKALADKTKFGVLSVINSKRGSLKDRLNSLKTSLSDLEYDGASRLFPEKTESANAKLTSADTNINETKFDDADKDLSEAEAVVNELKISLGGKKKNASDKIASVENELAELKKSADKDVSKPESLLADAKKFNDEKDYDSVIVKCDEALAEIDRLKTETAKVEVEEKAVEEAVAEKVKDDDGFPKEYVVKYDRKKRDCLWRIAGNYYDNQYDMWPLIYMANRDKIKDPDLIFPGQKLIIPSPDLYYKKKDEAGKTANEVSTDVDTENSSGVENNDPKASENKDSGAVENKDSSGTETVTDESGEIDKTKTETDGQKKNPDSSKKESVESEKTSSIGNEADVTGSDSKKKAVKSGVSTKSSQTDKVKADSAKEKTAVKENASVKKQTGNKDSKSAVSKSKKSGQTENVSSQNKKASSDLNKDDKVSKTEQVNTASGDSAKDNNKTVSASSDKKISEKNNAASADAKSADKSAETKSVSADSDEALFNAINKYEKDPVEKDKTAKKKEMSSIEDKQLKKPDSTFDIITEHSGK